MEELNLTKRIKTASHGARKVRREGKIPGVIYGKEIGNENIYCRWISITKRNLS